MPVINQLPGRIPTSPKKNRRPARATANERPSKGINQPGKVWRICGCERHRELASLGGQCPDSGKRSATPQGVAFVHLEGLSGGEPGSAPGYLLDATKVNLPASGVPCTIDLRIRRLTRATPTGRASSPLSKEVSPHHSFHIKLRRRKLS